jgi:arylsulfatase A-like enzyme
MRAFAYLLPVAGLVTSLAAAQGAVERPNILWITSEDNGPHLGCYGDEFATTPHLDALARRGTLYRNVWSAAPVCAPAPTAIISGMYPSSLGAEHMRSLVALPDSMKMYPQHLREAGYYCSNNSKEDYNLVKPDGVWDDSSGKAHYRNRAAGQPFFAVFNLTTTHESQIRSRPHTPVHDPDKVRVPAYHPDRPEVRQDWAQYYDRLTQMDAQAGRLLRDLEEAGLADQTVVFYYGDHGSGMPRSKRCLHNSGLRVPLIVYLPPAWQHLAPRDYQRGGASARMVSFVDLAPTVLSLAGVPPPAHFQGRAFLGRYARPSPQYLFGLRGRMDERPDLSRSVFDGRYVYIRNYQPHRPWGQHVAYMFETPTTRVWKWMFDLGQLNDVQSAFWRPKPPEELYDLEQDPDEVRNLAGAASHRQILERLRAAHRQQVLAIRDLGFLPEGEIHERAGADAPHDMARDPQRYPLQEIFEIAELAAASDLASLPRLRQALNANDSAVRYWAATGFLVRGTEAVRLGRDDLGRVMRRDPSPYVRVVAAEALGRFGMRDDAGPVLDLLLDLANAERHGPHVATLALNSIDTLGQIPASGVRAIEALPHSDPTATPRGADSPARLIKTLTSRLSPPPVPLVPELDLLSPVLRGESDRKP